MLSLNVRSESSIIKFSAAGAGFFALVGIGWGLWAHSMAIVFDGSYSLVSLGLSLLSLMALRVATSPADNRFNFGRLPAEPLAIAVKGLVILLVCLVSFGAAVLAIVHGGREVAAGKAIFFALLSVLLCFFIWWRLRKANTSLQSVLVEAEQHQWWMDGVLSLAVLLGFVLTWSLQFTALAHWALYADPVLVILVSGYFIQVPLKMLKNAVNELLMVSPSAELRKQVYRELESLGISHRQCKMAKSGSYLLLEVRIGIERVEQMQGVQQQLERKLAELPLEPVVWLDFYCLSHSKQQRLA